MKTITKLIIGVLAALIIVGCTDYDKEMLTMTAQEKLDKAGVTMDERQAMFNFILVCYPLAMENVANVTLEVGENGTLKEERALVYKYMSDACKNTKVSLVKAVENIRKQSGLKKYAVDAAIYDIVGELEDGIVSGEFEY